MLLAILKIFQQNPHLPIAKIKVQYFDDIRELNKLKTVLDEIVTLMSHFLILSITTNTLECELALRTVAWPCTCILITSDKVYDNVVGLGYKERGGIYSGSKGAAEKKSFFKRLQTTINLNRPGWKCIGGGDWALDRLVVDCFNGQK